MFPSFTSIDSERNAAFWLSRRAKITSPRVGKGRVGGQACVAKASLVYQDMVSQDSHAPPEGEGQGSTSPPHCGSTACLCEGGG